MVGGARWRRKWEGKDGRRERGESKKGYHEKVRADEGGQPVRKKLRGPSDGYRMDHIIFDVVDQ